jgi:PRTRC genetic system protein A
MNIPELVERKFLFAPDQPITAPLYEIVIAQNGVFKRAKRFEMSAIVEVSAFAVKIPELAVCQSKVELPEKIPASVFEQILAHARSVTDAANFTENLYAVCWNARNNSYYWKEISGKRSFASTIARDDEPAYQTAVLEIHTHPPGCSHFSASDDRDESGKFRLFGILVDIHAAKPVIRLRVGIYDSFWEIPVETVAAAPLENITDLVKQERESPAQIFQDLSKERQTYLFDKEFPHSVAENLPYVENL